MGDEQNRWIISTHTYAEHRTVEMMLAELERLRKAHPKKKFRVYRIKRTSKSDSGIED